MCESEDSPLSLHSSPVTSERVAPYPSKPKAFDNLAKEVEGIERLHERSPAPHVRARQHQVLKRMSIVSKAPFRTPSQ